MSYQRFRRNGQDAFPLTGNSSALASCDPFQRQALLFAQHCLNHHLSDKLKSIIDSYNSRFPQMTFEFAGNPDGYMAADVIPYPVTTYLSQASYRFPILSMSPVESRFFESTLAKRSSVTTYLLDLTFPPLNVDLAPYLHPFLMAAEKVLRNRFELGSDGSYVDGYGWGAGLYDSLRVVSCRYEDLAIKADASSNVSFPNLSMTLEVTQTDSFLPEDFEYLLGIDAALHKDSPGDERLENLVKLSIE